MKKIKRRKINKITLKKKNKNKLKYSLTKKDKKKIKNHSTNLQLDNFFVLTHLIQ